MPTAQELVSEFEEKKFDSILGRLIARAVIIDPITKLYADRELGLIVVKFEGSPPISIPPGDIPNLVEQSDEVIRKTLKKEEPCDED